MVFPNHFVYSCHCRIHARDWRTEVLVLDCDQGTHWLGDDFINKVVDWSIRFLLELCVLCMHFRFSNCNMQESYNDIIISPYWIGKRLAAGSGKTGECRPSCLWSRARRTRARSVQNKRSSLFCHPHLHGFWLVAFIDLFHHLFVCLLEFSIFKTKKDVHKM